MDAIALTPPEGPLTETTRRSGSPGPAGAGSFGELLQSSMDRIVKLQNEAERAVEDLTLGRPADLHTTMIAVEKAGIAVELALQVRNKLLNAYETLMRQQI